MIKINIKNFFSYKKPPLLIAEISGNHNGSKKRFLRLIKSAFENGADLVKIQTYEPEDIVNSFAKKVKIKNNIWKKKNLYELYKKACTPLKWHKDAFLIAKKFNKVLFSSPFSIRGVDHLEKMNVSIYKVASFEITDLKLINYIASKKKPIILSTGLSSLNEIKIAIKEIKKYHSNIIIFHCVSDYPTETKNTQLSQIKILKKKFPNFKIGLSDHTQDTTSSIVASSIGVVAIEKHYNLDDKNTPDSSFSINNFQLKKLKSEINDIFFSLRSKTRKMKKNNLFFRRSIFATKDIQLGEKLNKTNISTFRPLVGIGAEKYFQILGKKTNKKIKKNSPLFKKDID